MKDINKPFNIPSGNSTLILDNYIFSNNKGIYKIKNYTVFIYILLFILGLAFFILTIIVIILLSWDHIISKIFPKLIILIKKNIKINKRFEIFIKKFGSWYEYI